MIRLRARGIDRLGLVGDWSPWIDLRVDAQPVSLSLTDTVVLANAAGGLSTGNAVLSGGIADNRGIGTVEVCQADGTVCQAGGMTIDRSPVPTTKPLWWLANRNRCDVRSPACTFSNVRS